MSTRDRILDGAAEVMRTRGLANTTTKEIARAAGLSEAMLYKVCRDKVDLFLGVLSERLPRIAALRDGPAEHRGRGPMPGRRAAGVLPGVVPRSRRRSSPTRRCSRGTATRCGSAAPARTRWSRASRPTWPPSSEPGRVASTARPDVLAELLVGASLHRAFLVCFAGETATPDHIRRFAADVVTALEPALTP